MAQQEFGLPEYDNPKYRRFVAECYCKELKIRDYRGRFFYHGPAVSCDDIQTVIRATTVVVQWDHLGKGYIVYPK